MTEFCFQRLFKLYLIFFSEKLNFMSHESRVVCADYPYHVTQRGNYRQNVFADNKGTASFKKLF